MTYSQINPVTHLILQPLDRKKVEIEVIFSSGGSWFEESPDRGKKHLLEHCIASRTRNLDFQSLKDYQYRENIMLNAYTGPITMGLTASGHFSDYKKMLDIILEMAFVPTFDQSILDREKEIVLREISERRGDPNYRLHFDTMKEIFTTNSYSNHEVLGSSEMVANTVLDDFFKLHKKNIEKSHIILSVSGGGIDKEYTTLVLKDYCKKIGFDGKTNLTNEVNFQAKNTFLPFTKLPIVHELAHKHAELSIFIPCKVSFENKAILQIFENLFLKYGGVLYDRLRDDLGLVYGIQSNFDYNLQVLDIYLSCEVQYIETIEKEIVKVFSDFKSYFRSEKFEEFKKLIVKKQDISLDALGVATSFTQNMLRTYGMPEVYEDYAKRLDLVSQKDIEDVYNVIYTNISQMRMVIVSNDPNVESLRKD